MRHLTRAVLIFVCFVLGAAVSKTTTLATENYSVPYYVIGYLPRDASNPELIDATTVGAQPGTRVRDFEEKINRVSTQTAQYLTQASISIHDQQLQRSPSLTYEQFGTTKIYYEALPSGEKVPWSNANRPDYRSILNRENICQLVDSAGVKEIWLFGYHTTLIEPAESNMSMGRRSEKFFNRETYGDVSNSERSDDLPTCNSTYTLYNYNITRDVAEALENHTHQLEHIFNWIDGRDIVPNYRYSELLFWGKFVGSDHSHKILNPGCGWTHYPPNGESDYDWRNPRSIQSDCNNWNPQGSGQKETLTCTEWSQLNSDGTCRDDGGTTFKVWWMQRFPGKNNDLSFHNRPLDNWWKLVGDFDQTLMNGGGLVQPDTTPTFTISSRDGAVTLTRRPRVLPYSQLEIEFRGTNQNQFSEFIAPESCSESECVYRVPNITATGSTIIDSWRIKWDRHTPQLTSRNAVSSATGTQWQVISSTDQTYSAWIQFKDLPSPIPEISPSPLPQVTPSPTPTVCPSNPDITRDNRIDIFDYNALVAKFNPAATVTNEPADINCDGAVDIFDYNLLVSSFSGTM